MTITPPLTPEERHEWNYHYEERLGILEAGPVPTPEQDRLARADAYRAVMGQRKRAKEETWHEPIR